MAYGFTQDYDINIDWTHKGALIAQDVPVTVTVGVDSHDWEDGAEAMVVIDMTFGIDDMNLVNPQRINNGSRMLECQIWEDIEKAVAEAVEETFAEDWREEFGAPRKEAA
ncbi:hypothetical protein [Breoghania sp. JC706]|uniref:hypothetical protein n=1 Tax=Breoghania sp. JC706 TaxID=3117732 RepID=UPI00300A001A